MSTEMKFFDFAAAVGLTKHIGGMDATRQLVDLCQIEAGKYVLDVGCGVGVSGGTSVGGAFVLVGKGVFVNKSLGLTRLKAGRSAAVCMVGSLMTFICGGARRVEVAVSN